MRQKRRDRIYNGTRMALMAHSGKTKGCDGGSSVCLRGATVWLLSLKTSLLLPLLPRASCGESFRSFLSPLRPSHPTAHPSSHEPHYKSVTVNSSHHSGTSRSVRVSSQLRPQ